LRTLFQHDFAGEVRMVVEVAIVRPDILRELKLADEAAADDERRDAALNPIFGGAVRQRQTAEINAALSAPSTSSPALSPNAAAMVWVLIFAFTGAQKRTHFFPTHSEQKVSHNSGLNSGANVSTVTPSPST
jgi:hypothetical protein